MKTIIKIDQYNGCTSSECPFRKTCAQHETAGDFRSEDGFTPQIEVLKDGTVTCETINEGKLDHIGYGNIPRNVRSLGTGAIRRISAKPIYYNLRSLWSMPYGAEVEFVKETISSGYNCTVVRHKGIEHTQISEFVKSEKEVKELIDFHKKELHKWESILKNENLSE